MARAKASNEPQVSVLAQYVKDLSVENPSAPQVFQWQVQPNLDVQFNINVEKAADDVHEVTLKIESSARSDNGVHFVVDLSYAGLFGLRNMPEEALPPFLLIEAPRLIFPFARQIVAEAVTNTGFPPLLLDPIDFAAAYVAQLEAARSSRRRPAAARRGGRTDAGRSLTPPAQAASMNLIKSTGTIGGLTMVSRIAGFAREMLMSRILGAGVYTDAFYVAFRLPNTFRRLFGEGAFSAGFVPLYSQRLQSGGEAEAKHFSEEVLAVFLPTLILFTVAVRARSCRSFICGDHRMARRAARVRRPS